MPEEDDPSPAVATANLPASLPREDGIDLDFLARQFRVSGGNIKNICVTAAYLVAG
jgi:hypothetical protein